MKRKIILWLSYLIAFLSVLWSCHNEDFANGKAEPQRNNANFFLHSKRGGAAARGGIDYAAILEAYNSEQDFLATIPDQQGMPIWDKMQVLDNGEKTILYVPLSADKAGLSSLLIVNIDEENTVARLQNFTNDYLEAYIYNADNPAAKRKLLMDTFLQMDFFTFGHQEFTNLPKDIYKGSTEYNRLNIPDVKIEAEQSKGFIYNTICTTYHFCVHGHSTSSCDYGSCTCGGLISCFLVTSCTTTATWVDDSPFPSFPGSHGGGGGGGTPRPQPPIDPCVMNTVFYRIKPGCLGNAGDPGIDGLDDPCEKIKKSTSDSKYKSDITNLEGKTGLDHEEGYRLGNPISGSGQTGTQNQLLQNLPGTHEVDMKIFSNTFALMHTHYDGIYPIFSPGDILLFNNWIIWANTWNSVSTNTPKIPLNNLTLTVVTSNGNYLLAFDGSVVDPLPAYTQEQFDDLNTKYKKNYLDNTHTNGNFNMEKVEKEFLSFISEKMNMTGLKLYRVKNDGNYEISLSNLDSVKCP